MECTRMHGERARRDGLMGGCIVWLGVRGGSGGDDAGGGGGAGGAGGCDGVGGVGGDNALIATVIVVRFTLTSH